MTSCDKLIAGDLANLASENRRGVVALDDMLRAIDTRCRDVPPVRGELVMARIAHVVALRVARAASGAVALAFALGLLGLLYRPGLARTDGWPTSEPWWFELLRSKTTSIAFVCALALLASHAAAAQLARRWIDRRLRAARDGDARLGHLIDRWSIVLSIWGTSAAVTLLAVGATTLGRQPWTWFLYAGADAGTLLSDRLRDVATAIAATGSVALVIGRGCALERRWLAVLEHPATLAIGVALAAIGAVLAHRLGALAADRDLVGQGDGRSVLAALIALAALVTTTSISLRRRRRELRAIPDAALRVRPDRGLSAAAEIFADRMARLAGGAVAALAAIATRFALYRPHAVSTRGPFWWDHERTTVAIDIVFAILVVRHVVRERVARTASMHAARDARAIDAWAVGVGAGGAAALAAVFSVAHIAVGNDLWAFFEPHGARLNHVLSLALRLMAIAIPLAFAAGAGLARACAVDACLLRVLERTRVLVTAGGLAAITLVVGTIFDFGVQDISVPSSVPPAALQRGLSLVSVLSILVFTASVTLRRRRREQARLAA